MSKLLVLALSGFVFSLLFFNPPKPISKQGRPDLVRACYPAFGDSCPYAGYTCCDGSSCTYSASKGGYFCGSSGHGLTVPTCTITFTSPAIAGQRLTLAVSAGDSGETYVQNGFISGSGICPTSNWVGWCGTGNVCAANGQCSICDTPYTYPTKSGTCTVSMTVYNYSSSTGAYQSSTCSSSIAVSCPSQVVLSGRFIGNPITACVDVFNLTNGGIKVGTFCGATSWRSVRVPSGMNYNVVPKPISGYTVSPPRQQTGATCTDVTGLNFTYSRVVTYQHLTCQNNACVRVDCLPNTSACPDTCSSNSQCVAAYQHRACVGATCSLIDCTPNTTPCPDTCTSSSQCSPTVYQHKTCVGSTCSLVDCIPNTSACSDTCMDSSSCTPVANGFYQTFGGDVTAAEFQLTDPNLPTSFPLSGNAAGISDAGVVAADPINLSSGTLISQMPSGSAPGWNLSPYSYLVASSKVSYQYLLGAVLRNARASWPIDCNSGSGRDFAPFRLWCYTSSANLNLLLQKAHDLSDPDTPYQVFIPDPNLGLGDRSVSVPFLFNKAFVIFVDQGNLTVKSRLQVDSSNSQAALVSVVGGDLIVDPGVDRMDGVHLFSGVINDFGTQPVLGNGSLLGGVGKGPTYRFVFARNYNSFTDPSEKWTYDGRYLDLFKNVLSVVGFHWEELPPQ